MKKVLGIFNAIFAIILTLACYTVYQIHYQVPKATTLVVKKGETANDVAKALYDNQAIANSYFFEIIAYLIQNHFNKYIIAGEYRFCPGDNLLDILFDITRGNTKLSVITIPEGITSKNLYHLLGQNHEIDFDLLDENQIKEGSILPETYHYAYGRSASYLITVMQRNMRDFLEQEWAKRDQRIDQWITNQHEAVILASIVEKETALASERRRIAGLYINRLQKKMRLQADPSIVFAMNKDGHDKKRLTYDDLKFQSPYNTYTTRGLPPTAICHPGKQAILAVLHPEFTDEIFFVANGSGGHFFAKSFQEHKENIKRAKQLRNNLKSDELEL